VNFRSLDSGSQNDIPYPHSCAELQDWTAFSSVPFPARGNEVRARAHALPPCRAQQESEARGRIEHRKMDRTLVAERKILLKTWGVAVSRACQNRKYGELPKRTMVKVKAGENSQRK
jgi:hypothetical protein